MPRTKGSTNKPKTTKTVPVVSDPAPNLDLVEDVQNVQTEQTSKTKKNIFICKRCGAESETYLSVIDTNVLTMVADYHRESPRRYDLCRKCCNSLSKTVDEWWLEEGKGKFNQ